MSPLSLVPWMGAIAAVGILLDSIETLVERKSLSPTGMYSWKVLALGRRYLVKGPFASPLSKLFRYPAVLALPVIQIILGVALLAAPFLSAEPQRWTVAIAALTAAVARMLFYMRQQLGLDGADQMVVIVLISAGFGAVFGNTAAGNAAVDYAALQLLLSYAIAGIAKAVSKSWRSGQAMVGITGTIGYGQEDAHVFLERRPNVAKTLCWSVILFECGAGPFVLLGYKAAWVVILLGASFHIGIALVMGLNTFVWAFAGSYPALLLLSVQISGWIRHLSAGRSLAGIFVR